jgi:hypothetical protein
MKLVITGVKPYDGSYDMIRFNRRELGQIRRLSGFMPMEIEDAFNGGDAELITAVAVLALLRADRIQLDAVPEMFGRLLDSDDADIDLVADTEEEKDDAGPPPGSSSSSKDSSGPASRMSSAASTETPRTTGTPVLASSPSGRATSGN